MNILKRVFAFAAAYLICVGLFVVFLEYLNFEKVQFKNYVLYLILHSIEINLVFASPVFLTCWFFPQPKKSGVLISVIPCFILIISGIIYIFLNQQVFGDLGIRFIVSYLSAFTGSGIGVLISYYRFKNKGWVNPPAQIELEQSY